jgi:hypothetical protein
VQVVTCTRTKSPCVYKGDTWDVPVHVHSCTRTDALLGGRKATSRPHMPTALVPTTTGARLRHSAFCSTTRRARAFITTCLSVATLRCPSARRQGPSRQEPVSLRVLSDTQALRHGRQLRHASVRGLPRHHVGAHAGTRVADGLACNPLFGTSSPGPCTPAQTRSGLHGQPAAPCRHVPCPPLHACLPRVLPVPQYIHEELYVKYDSPHAAQVWSCT